MPRRKKAAIEKQVPLNAGGSIPSNRSYAASSTIERGTAGKLAADLVGDAGSKREPCICGCGETPTSPTSLFMPGHDSRVRHLGKLILEGQMNKGDLTKPQRQYLDQGGFFESRTA